MTTATKVTVGCKAYDEEENRRRKRIRRRWYFFITRLICERTAALIPTPIFWAREKVKKDHFLGEK